MWDFHQGFPVSFIDFLGSWIPEFLLKFRLGIICEKTREIERVLTRPFNPVKGEQGQLQRT
jgi:hypothetical protein